MPHNVRPSQTTAQNPVTTGHGASDASIVASQSTPTMPAEINGNRRDARRALASRLEALARSRRSSAEDSARRDASSVACAPWLIGIVTRLADSYSMVVEFRTSVDIAAPSEVVWAVMSDVERWHEWTQSVRSIRLVGGGPIGVGTRARIKQPRFPPAMWKVTALEPGRSFTWESGAPGMRVYANHSVQPVAG